MHSERASFFICTSCLLSRYLKYSGASAARAAHTHMKRIDGSRRGDEQAIAIQSAEGQIGYDFGYQDLAEQRAIGRVAMHAVFGAGPDVAVLVDAHAVWNATLHLRKNTPVAQTAFARHIEYADMARRVVVVRSSGIDDIKFALVRRERETVRLRELVADQFHLRAAGADAIDVTTTNFAVGAITFVVAQNAVVRIGEPDVAFGIHDYIVRRIEALAFEVRRQHRPAAVVFGARHASRAVLAGHEPSLAVTRVAIAVVGRRTINAYAHPGRPTHHAVVRYVAPDKQVCRREIDRTFGPKAFV